MFEVDTGESKVWGLGHSWQEIFGRHLRPQTSLILREEGGKGRNRVDWEGEKEICLLRGQDGYKRKQ